MESNHTTAPPLPSTQLTLGTRGSLLAKTQSTLLLNQLKELFPHLHIRMKCITTQGDVQQSSPLHELNGSQFFTKELDQALLQGEVDFVVHSYKDLGLKRPTQFHPPIITQRYIPNDILLIPENIVDALPSLKQLVIGTSSPRRQVLLKKSIHHYLPHFNGDIIFKPLRGNVNTRLEKLHRGEADCLVLAFAGLERLCEYPDSRETIAPLLDKLQFQILPFSDFPWAPGQGALAIECLKDNIPLVTLLKSLHCKESEEVTARERALLRDYGGGCHLPMGLAAIKREGICIENQQGIPSGKEQVFISRTITKQGFSIKDAEAEKENVFLGMPLRQAHPRMMGDEMYQKKIMLPEPGTVQTRQHLFLTTPGVSGTFIASRLPHSMWTSGTRTSKYYTQQEKLWIHGTADSLGTSLIHHYLDSHLLQILLKINKTKSPPQILLFTHPESMPTRVEREQVVAIYVMEPKLPTDNAFLTKLHSIRHFYWASFPQYQRYTQHFPFITTRHHHCGLGKTYRSFRDNQIPCTPWFSATEFKQRFFLCEP